jgi:hypothetical protein
VAGENGGNGSVLIAPVDSPTIAGTVAGQTTTVTTPIDPFTGIVISDPNLGSLPETVTVTPSTTANGALSDPNAATDHSSISGGVYTVSGTATQVQADLRALVFTPAANTIGDTTTFSVEVTNVAGQAVTDNETSVTDQSPAVASEISGTKANQPTTDEATIKPFSAVTITDTNSGSPTETVTVTPGNTANGTLSDPNAASDGGTFNNGVYTISGSAGAVTKALDGLVFTPTAHEVAPGQAVTTGFTISDTNSANKTTTDNTTSVVTTAVDDPPTLINPVLSLSPDTVSEGQTLQGLYSQLLANVKDVDFGAQAKLTISTIGQSNTMGFLNFDSTDHLLTYRASGFNPNQPTDSFTYTVPDPYGTGSVTGTVDVTITGPDLPTRSARR